MIMNYILVVRTRDCVKKNQLLTSLQELGYNFKTDVDLFSLLENGVSNSTPHFSRVSLFWNCSYSFVLLISGVH